MMTLTVNLPPTSEVVWRLCGSVVGATNGFKVGAAVSASLVAPPSGDDIEGMDSKGTGIAVGVVGLLVVPNERIQGAFVPSSQYTPESRIFDTQQWLRVPSTLELQLDTPQTFQRNI